ncbi:glucosyl-3-phosphoglycerate synthase, partial [bacterium]
PVLPGVDSSLTVELARQLGGEIHLVGLVRVPPDSSISAEASTARKLRKRLQALRNDLPNTAPSRVYVAHDPWAELQNALAGAPIELILLEYPKTCTALGKTLDELMNKPACNLAIVRGPLPAGPLRILTPVRGGPSAVLALRFSLSLQHKEVRVLNLTPPNAPETLEAPFRGLASILPSLRGVHYRREASTDPIRSILEQAAAADILVMGASNRPAAETQPIGRSTEDLLRKAPGAAVILRSFDAQVNVWSGAEGELAGAQAISLLVDRWFAENTYHANEFADLEHMLAVKKEQGVTISLALPALNEAENVSNVIRAVKGALMDSVPLLDEIVLIDSNSTDATREIAASLGVPVHVHQKLLPNYGARIGKGEALWKSLLVTHGDIVLWIDTDIVNIHPRFVYGVLGPLLFDPRVQFVKGFYQRPLKSGEVLEKSGGGRVTELTARPLLNLYYPELSGVIQPLSGEYGGRRKALEQLHFFSRYGVEIGLLIETFEKFGLSAIAQVDLLERVHHNQTLEALSKMSFQIQQAVMRRLESRHGHKILQDVNKTMKLIRYEGGNYYLEVEEVAERERPPMIELPEYRAEHGIPEPERLPGMQGSPS